MTRERRPLERWLVRVLVFAFLQTLVLQSVRPMVSYRALDLGADGVWLGVIAGAYALFSFAAAVPLGQRVERWGEPWMLVVGNVITIASTASLLIIDSLWALALSQAFFGLGQVMVVVGMQALVGNAGDPYERDRRFGALTVVVSFSQFIAPAAAGLIAGGGLAAGVVESGSVDTALVFTFAVATAGLAFLVAASMILWRPEGAGPVPRSPVRTVGERSRVAVSEVLAIPGMTRALFVGMSVITAIDVITAYLPAFAEEAGISVQTVGFLLATRALAAIASRVAMLRLMRWLGRRTLLLVAVLVAGASLAIFPFVPLAMQYGVMVLVGLGLGLGHPVTLSWVAGRAPRALRGPALGIRVSGNRLGQVIVPGVVGVLTGVAGVGIVFAALATSLLMSAIVLLGAKFDLPSEPEA